MNRRELKGFWSVSAVALAVLVPFASIVYVLQILPDLGIIVYKEQFLALFLALCVAITFLILPPRENVAETSGVPWYDVICALAALAVGGYIFFNYGDLVGSLGIITTDKVIASAIGTLLLFEATRRQAGWSMVTVGLVALAYAYFGHFLSGMFETRVIRWDRLLTYNYLGAGAIFGTPLYVAATIVTSFVLFGQILFLIGGDDETRAAMAEHIFHLFGDRVLIEWHRHRADRLRGDHRPVEIRPVAADDGHEIALVHAEIEQAQSQRLDLLRGFGPGPALPDSEVFLAIGGLACELRRIALQQRRNRAQSFCAPRRVSQPMSSLCLVFRG